MDFARLNVEKIQAAGEVVESTERQVDDHTLVNLAFHLPDGKVCQHAFQLGHEVAQIKLFLQETYGFNFADLRLKFNDKLMCNPLTLTDYPSIIDHKGGDIHVQI